jgi:hypothetical protein
MNEQWPKIIRSGSVAVKIYQQDCGGYKQHIVSYYLGLKRVRKVISDFAKAKKEAERIANRLSHGETQALKLTSEDSAAYLEARRLLSSVNVPLLAAIEEYCEAKKLGVPLLAQPWRLAPPSPGRHRCLSSQSDNLKAISGPQCS